VGKFEECRLWDVWENASRIPVLSVQRVATRLWRPQCYVRLIPFLKVTTRDSLVHYTIYMYCSGSSDMRRTAQRGFEWHGRENDRQGIQNFDYVTLHRATVNGATVKRRQLTGRQFTSVADNSATLKLATCNRRWTQNITVVKVYCLHGHKYYNPSNSSPHPVRIIRSSSTHRITQYHVHERSWYREQISLERVAIGVPPAAFSRARWRVRACVFRHENVVV